MVDVEPASNEVARVVVALKATERSSATVFVPIVDEYVDEEQENGTSVYTLDDLHSEILTALTLQEEGVLSLPSLVDGKLGTVLFRVVEIAYVSVT